MSEASISLPRAIAPHGPIRLAGDDRLVRLAAAGNERAFATIYERHHQGLYRYCRSILGNDADAQDALQNTMLKALRALPGERRELALKPWLYRIAHNEAISLLRRRAGDDSIDEVGDVQDTRGGDAATRERLRTLVSDLAQLPERQRTALVMRELSGLGYREIGAALDTSPAAAKQAVYEAREGLQALSEGREMECEAARRSISARDRRLLRGRKLRAHLHSCDGCRAFELAIRNRRADLAALAPPLQAGAAAALLDGIIGGGGGTGGGGLLGLLTGAAGKTAAGSAAMKATVAAVTVAVGVGTYEVVEQHGVPIGGSAEAASATEPSDVSQGSKPAYDGWAGGASDDQAPASDGNGRPQAQGPGAPGNWESASHGTPPGLGGTPPGDGGSPSGLDAEDPASYGGNPPGLEGAAPPAQGGSLPGLEGATPPGQGGSPFGLEGGTPPGQGGSPPGLEGGTTPGQGGSPPGLEGGTTPTPGGTPAGLGGTPPAQGGTSPGLAGGAPPAPSGATPGPAALPAD
jgi:RNA polymerase sigma factor (sigma-70 family)